MYDGVTLASAAVSSANQTMGYLLYQATFGAITPMLAGGEMPVESDSEVGVGVAVIEQSKGVVRALELSRALSLLQLLGVNLHQLNLGANVAIADGKGVEDSEKGGGSGSVGLPISDRETLCRLLLWLVDSDPVDDAEDALAHAAMTLYAGSFEVLYPLPMQRREVRLSSIFFHFLFLLRLARTITN